ncbi:MAG: methyltransferase [Paludibacter sp.]|nr:methyltransferase [Paludibacter sp.]
MPNPYFSFKQFTVYHDKCAMKVGIDGVLLGAWANVDDTNSILDVGTGTGLIALMLAQRSSAELDAIDIDENAVLQANENINNSVWNKRIRVQRVSLQDFAQLTSKKYDLIVSNPPYFINSLKTPVESRTTARHTDTLSHEELLINAKCLLNNTGRICLILPVTEGIQCLNFSKSIGLFCSRKVIIYPKPNTSTKRILLEFNLLPTQLVESEITIESNERHSYTPEFTKLVKDYYLKL